MEFGTIHAEANVPSKSKAIAGNLFNKASTMFKDISFVGVCLLVFFALNHFLGLGLIAAVIIFILLGLVTFFISSKIQTDQWFGSLFYKITVFTT